MRGRGDENLRRGMYVCKYDGEHMCCVLVILLGVLWLLGLEFGSVPSLHALVFLELG